MLVNQIPDARPSWTVQQKKQFLLAAERRHVIGQTRGLEVLEVRPIFMNNDAVIVSPGGDTLALRNTM